MSVDEAQEWEIHIVGPDDVIDKGIDELEALREANALNAHLERDRRQFANDPDYPYAIAIVRKKGASLKGE